VSACGHCLMVSRADLPDNGAGGWLAGVRGAACACQVGRVQPVPQYREWSSIPVTIFASAADPGLSSVERRRSR
jgi:hypothetical protein